MKMPYAHQQALAFLGACALLGSAIGALVAAAKGWLR